MASSDGATTALFFAERQTGTVAAAALDGAEIGVEEFESLRRRQIPDTAARNALDDLHRQRTTRMVDSRLQISRDGEKNFGRERSGGGTTDLKISRNFRDWN
jgi:hypothetical protein